MLQNILHGKIPTESRQTWRTTVTWESLTFCREQGREMWNITKYLPVNLHGSKAHSPATKLVHFKGKLGENRRAEPTMVKHLKWGYYMTLCFLPDFCHPGEQALAEYLILLTRKLPQDLWICTYRYCILPTEMGHLCQREAPR